MIVYEFYGVDVLSMYSAIWPVTVCLFIYSLIKYGVYYLDDKKNLTFMLTHPDSKVRYRGTQVKTYGKKLILMNSLKLFEEISIVKRTQKYKETSFRCVDI